jgi:hypothetical protein
MKDFAIPRKIELLKLSEYADGFGDIVFHVWVNPPRRLLINHDDMVFRVKALTTALMSLKGEIHKLEADTKSNPSNSEENAKKLAQIEARKQETIERMARVNEEMTAWLSEIWSQGPEETRMSVEEVKAFLEKTLESDPSFNAWITAKTAKMIADHTEAVKKGLAPRS